MDIFPIESWFVIIAMIICVSVGLYVTCAVGINAFHRVEDSEDFTVINSLALSVMLLIQLSYDAEIRSMATRILYLIVSIACYIIFSYYAADLTARMTSGMTYADT